MDQSIEEIVRRPYHITLVYDRDDDGGDGYVASVSELPGCLSQGNTPQEAAANIQDAMIDWLETALELGHEIPSPREEPAGYSGRILVRLPRTLHAELVADAEREGVSLNQFIVAALSGAVAWRRPLPSTEPLGALLNRHAVEGTAPDIADLRGEMGEQIANERA